VRAIAPDREGRLWFGTNGGGASRYDGGASRYDGHSFQTFTKTKDGLAADYVRAIAPDREGRLWFGTWGGGASRYDGQSFQTFTQKDGLADDDVRVITPDREGRLWFATPNGISVYQGTEVLGSPSRLVVALTLKPRLISYGPPTREVLWSYRLDNQHTWSEPSPGGFVRDYWRLGSGKHVLKIRAWDGEANPPRTTIFPFEVSGSEQSIAIAIYLLLVVVPAGIGLYRIGKRQAARWAIQRRFNPYRAGLPVGPGLFTGRDDLLKRVTATLANHCILLTGERRIGKTSFLHALERRLPQIEEATWRWIPCYATLEGISESAFFTTLAGPLAESVGKELPPGVRLRYSPEVSPASPPYGFQSFVSDVVAITHALDTAGGKPVKLVFLIDEVDTLNAYSAEIKRNLRSLFQMPDLKERVRMVMTGFHLNESVPEMDGSPPFNYLHVRLIMPPFQEAESRSLILEPVRGFYRFEPGAVERIVTLSEGRPLVIQAFGLRLIERILDEKRRKVTLGDVEAVREQVLDEVRTVMKSGSSHSALPANLNEALERIAALERELAATGQQPGGSTQIAGTSPRDGDEERSD
jgi:hypothetical protein